MYPSLRLLVFGLTRCLELTSNQNTPLVELWNFERKVTIQQFIFNKTEEFKVYTGIKMTCVSLFLIFMQFYV